MSTDVQDSEVMSCALRPVGDISNKLIAGLMLLNSKVEAITLDLSYERCPYFRGDLSRSEVMLCTRKIITGASLYALFLVEWASDTAHKKNSALAMRCFTLEAQALAHETGNRE